MTEPTAQEREAYVDLTQRYRWLYGQGLQARMTTQLQDIGAWCAIGRRVDQSVDHQALVLGVAGSTPAPPSKPEPEPVHWGDLPDKVREVIRAVAQERGVSPADIVGYRKTGRIAEARQECYRRLRAMPWRGDHPSLIQIGIWLHRDHTTIHHGVNK